MRAVACQHARGLRVEQKALARCVSSRSLARALTSRRSGFAKSYYGQRRSELTSCQRLQDIFPLSSSLAEYDIDFHSPLGYGAFGTVFPAHHIPSNRVVAIKTVCKHSTNAECVLDPSELTEGIEQETKAFTQILQAGVSHPHVVDVMACFEGPAEEAVSKGLDLPKEAVGEPLHYFVMEKIEGNTLQERLDKGDCQLEEAEAKKMLLAMCQGLECLHQNGIVHRDVKPANYMLLTDAEDPEVKLIDFSHAGVVPDDATSDATIFTKKLGTAGYIAPEVLSEREPYNSKCDVFSLGCTLHAMLANGRLPRRHPRIGILPNLPQSTSPRMREMVDSLLAYCPEDRPTVSDILNEPWLQPHVE